MMIFGGGCDLCIFNECEKNANSYSNIGDSY